MPSEIDAIQEALVDVKKYFEQKTAEKLAPVQKDVTELTGRVKEAMTALNIMQQEKASRIAEDGKLRVQTGRLAGMDLLSLKIADVMARRKFELDGSCHNLINEVAEQRKAMLRSISIDRVMQWEDIQLRRLATKTKDGMFSEPMRGKHDELARWRRDMVGQVTKALDSTTAAKGDELVPTFEAAELWMDVNLDTIILPLMQQMPMPTNPFDIPIQFGDTNWYSYSENVQITTTDIATQKVTLTAYGLKTGVPFSDELEEDAIIALVPEIRSALVRNAADVIDDVLLNADTTVTNGINSDGATISKNSAGKSQWLLGFDGLRHLAVVDNSANQSFDAATNVSADIFNRTLAKMGKYALPRRTGDVVFVSDVPTSVRALSITEFETVDVAGARNTLSTGEFMNVYGKPYVATDEMRQADNDGLVTDAGNATTTLGSILAVNTTQWRVGFRRQIALETQRDAGKGQTVMYASFRIALTERSGTRSTAKHAALAFNITGVSS